MVKVGTREDDMVLSRVEMVKIYLVWKLGRVWNNLSPTDLRKTNVVVLSTRIDYDVWCYETRRDSIF